MDRDNPSKHIEFLTDTCLISEIQFHFKVDFKSVDLNLAQAKRTGKPEHVICHYLGFPFISCDSQAANTFMSPS